MRVLFAAVAAALVVAVAAPSAPAQSLAEVAARTKDKDKKGKVFTEADLRRPSSNSSATLSQPGQAAPVEQPKAEGEKKEGGAAPAEKEKTEDELRAEKETEWRERLQKAQAEVARLTAEIQRIQTALNDISGPLYGGNRAGLITRLGEAQKLLATAQQSVTDLEEEGRRSRFRS